MREEEKTKPKSEIEQKKEEEEESSGEAAATDGLSSAPTSPIQKNFIFVAIGGSLKKRGEQ